MLDTGAVRQFMRLFDGYTDYRLIGNGGRLELWHSTSTNYGTIVVGEKGEIKGFNFGSGYEGITVFSQLIKFLTSTILSKNFDFDVRPGADCVVVNVATIEHYADRTGTFRRVLASFDYHPIPDILTEPNYRSGDSTPIFW